LLHTPLLDGDFAIKRRREAIDHTALDLCLDNPGIDHVTAIHGGDHTINLDFAFLANSHFGHLTNDRSVALVDSDAAPAALTKRLTPLALLCDRVEHAEEVGFARKQGPAELVGVLPGRLRQLVYITFDKERILRGTDRSPEHDWHVRVLQHTADTHARN